MATASTLFRFHTIGTGADEVHWPDDSVERMSEAVHLRTEWGGRSWDVLVGRVDGGRFAFDWTRERIHVVVAGSVQAEFVGSDDFDETRKLVAVLKKPGGNLHAHALAELPPEYRSFRVERFSDLIRQRGAFSGLGVVVVDGDWETMAAYGLLRARDRAK